MDLEKQNKWGKCEKCIPAQDLIVWILRSRTRTLAKWVMSPASLNIFIFSPFASQSLSLSLQINQKNFAPNFWKGPENGYMQNSASFGVWKGNLILL